MLTLRPPSAGDIAAFVGRQQTAPFSYTPAGATCDRAPHGYVVDHNRVKLGAGERTFARAVDAVRRWEMFNIGWVTLCWPNVPIEADRTVAILIPLFGLWLLNACRIVYVLDGDGPSDGNIRRFGFAYGTLPDHMESGEERFSVGRVAARRRLGLVRPLRVLAAAPSARATGRALQSRAAAPLRA